MVKKKQFREDLLYRLNVLELRLPPLRERKEDIPALIDSYLKLHGTPIVFSEEAMKLLCSAEYPGNVRHLFNIVERILALTENNQVLPRDLNDILPMKQEPDSVPQKSSPFPNTQILLTDEMEDYEKLKIQEALQKNQNSRSLTAKELHISTATLWRKMKKYHLLD